MAVPTTKQQFKEYCLRALGKPVIEINVDDDQVEDRVDEALKYFVAQCTENKYSKWYFSLIDKALKRDWNKNNIDFYVENHHYIPKSLGGTDNHTVLLTAKEHFICHFLLTKMLKGDFKAKMVWAVMCLKGKDNRYINASLYENAKKDLGHTDKAKLKMTNTRILNGTFKGEKNPMYGKTGALSPSFGKKQSLEHKQKRLSKIIGRKQSEEACLKMKQNRPRGTSGKKWFNNGVYESFDLPENKPDGFTFGRLARKL